MTPVCIVVQTNSNCHAELAELVALRQERDALVLELLEVRVQLAQCAECSAAMKEGATGSIALATLQSSTASRAPTSASEHREKPNKLHTLEIGSEPINEPTGLDIRISVSNEAAASAPVVTQPPTHLTPARQYAPPPPPPPHTPHHLPILHRHPSTILLRARTCKRVKANCIA
jgi:hypothetical protein